MEPFAIGGISGLLIIFVLVILGSQINDYFRHREALKQQSIDADKDEMRALLLRIQAADQAYPQLPLEIRTDIDHTVTTNQPEKSSNG